MPTGLKITSVVEINRCAYIRLFILIARVIFFNNRVGYTYIIITKRKTVEILKYLKNEFSNTAFFSDTRVYAFDIDYSDALF